MRLEQFLLVALAAPIASAQLQSQKAIASDAYAGQKFGTAIAASGDWMVVGVFNDDQVASQAGAAYVFQRVAGSWLETQKLFASDAATGDLFGYAVAIDGSTLVVSARNEDPAGVNAAGSAYVFERVASTWVETAKLNSSVLYGSAFFGWSVAVHNDRVLVGAREEPSGGGFAGAAYVFERNGPGWTQTARLVASDGQSFDFFGQRVALFGDTALIGASADGPAGVDQGAAYVFEFDGVSWNQVAKLYASDGGPTQAFGANLALGNGVALVSAYIHSHGVPNSGSVYAFERLGGTWTEVQELRAQAPMNGVLFGTRVALHGDVALIGAVHDPNQADSRGAVYGFRHGPSGWQQIARFTANDVNDYDTLGESVALSGATALVGVPFRDDLCPTNFNCNSGAVYVFDLAPDARQFGWCMNSAPCNNTFTVGGCLNSTGVGATLAAAGSSSVVRNDLRFEVRHAQPSKNAILFMGNGVGQAVLGDGLRVVASGTSGFYRYGVQTVGADGSFQQGGIVAKSQTFALPGHIQSGSVWNFQCWYRDPAGPCVSGTNVTNAVEVTFGP